MEHFSVEVPTPMYWRRQVKCQDACPVHTDSRGYVRAIAQGRADKDKSQEREKRIAVGRLGVPGD